jgi:hypothetical protein
MNGGPVGWEPVTLCAFTAHVGPMYMRQHVNQYGALRRLMPAKISTYVSSAKHTIAREAASPRA